MRKLLATVALLLVAAELSVQLLFGDADMAQLLSPGGSILTVLLVLAALLLRLAVIVALPSWLTYRLIMGVHPEGASEE